MHVPILFAVDVIALIKGIEMKNLLSVTALADLLGVARQTIYNRHFLHGDLPPTIKIGTRLLFDPVDVQNWIDEKKQTARPPAPVALPVRGPGRPTKAESIARRKLQNAH